MPICAISTPPGVGGIAIIRVSGENTFETVCRIFTPRGSRSLLSEPGYSILLGEITDGTQTIDEVLLSLFRAPHSFTGEDSIEISCHGSIFIQQKILSLLLHNGATMAAPGEFTQRAFLNGKMDLSQAEGVADLIASTNAAAHQLAITQMRGGFSQKLASLRDELIRFTSLIELELDFSEEDVEFADRTEVLTLAQTIAREITRLADSFQTGNAIKNGIPVAIVGETNAGKSTLLNLLLNEEKAIVSDIHGTTRDFIEDVVVINGTQFRFIDTAGLRDTDDTIETIGINRSYSKMQQAQIILWMFDASHPLHHIQNMFAHITERSNIQNIICIANKTDLLNPSTAQSHLHSISSFLPKGTPLIALSAKQQQGIEQLEQLLIDKANPENYSPNDIVVSNMRHYQALNSASEAMKRVENGLEINLSGDLLSQDIREVIHYLGEITGQISNQDILSNIFANFCIGK